MSNIGTPWEHSHSRPFTRINTFECVLTLGGGQTSYVGFQEYMAGCDGLALASVPDQLASRIGYWNAALSAFHITNDTTNH